jgi:hypothetical protein
MIKKHYSFKTLGKLFVMNTKNKQSEVILSVHKGYIHVKAQYGSPGYDDFIKLQGLTSVQEDLTKFELKVMCLHIYRIMRNKDKNKKLYLDLIKYESIFGEGYH